MRCCWVYNTKSGEGYSLHGFPREQDLHAKWVRAVKRQQSNWDGPSRHSMLCSKHFEADCFVTEGVWYRDSIGLPTKKHLKAGAVPTIFPSAIHGAGRSSSPPPRRAAEKRQRQAVSSKMYHYSKFIHNKYLLIYIDSRRNPVHKHSG